MRNTFRLAWQGIKHINLQHILLSLELLIMLMLIYMCGGKLMEILADERYFNIFSKSKIAACDPENEAAVRFCEENGSFLGTIEKLDFNDNIMYLQSPELFKEFYGYVPLGKGDYQVAAVVTKSLSGMYSVGEVYDITFTIREAYRNRETLEMVPAVYAEAKVYICGILKPNIIYDGYYFSEGENQMIGVAVEGELKNYRNDSLQSWNYYCMNTEAALQEAATHGAKTIKDDITSNKRMRQQQIFPIALLAGVLLVIFTTGFLGQHILNTEDAKQRYAIYFMCGAGTGKALRLQFIQDISGLVLPAGLSLLIIKLLENAANQALLYGVSESSVILDVMLGLDFNWTFNFICCIVVVLLFAVISVIEIFYIKRAYPVDILRRE